MSDEKIGFIGAGNMAQAIFGGLIKSGTIAENIIIFEPNKTLATQLVEKWQCQAAKKATDVLAQCDVIVLAVKPQIMRDVLSNLAGHPINTGAFLISVAAGLPINLMQKWLRAPAPMVRVMPNTPALVGAGVSGLFASDEVNDAQKQSAESILRAVGSVIWVKEESLIDSVTAVSGSGPAYFFYMIEALEQAAHVNGLTAEQARILSLETAFGAAKLALESDVSSAELRMRVTSPGGTTEAALAEMEKASMAETIDTAVAAAVRRSRELAKLADQ